MVWLGRVISPGAEVGVGVVLLEPVVKMVDFSHRTSVSLL